MSAVGSYSESVICISWVILRKWDMPYLPNFAGSKPPVPRVLICLSFVVALLWVGLECDVIGLTGVGATATCIRFARLSLSATSTLPLYGGF